MPFLDGLEAGLARAAAARPERIRCKPKQVVPQCGAGDRCQHGLTAAATPLRAIGAGTAPMAQLWRQESAIREGDQPERRLGEPPARAGGASPQPAPKARLLQARAACGMGEARDGRPSEARAIRGQRKVAPFPTD